MTTRAAIGVPTEVLVAPDSFKGTFAAAEVAHALQRGLAASGQPAQVCPVADGGEGTLAALTEPLELEWVVVSASDPLGRELEAGFGIGGGSGGVGGGGGGIGGGAGRGVAGGLRTTGRRGAADRRGAAGAKGAAGGKGAGGGQRAAGGKGAVAVVEMAAASGLVLVAEDERDAVAASSYGTGELIAAAVAAGATTVYVAAGGSATSDGGEGAIRALQERGGIGTARLVVLCDVRTPFELAPVIFAPQKGASPEQVRALERRLDALAHSLPRDPRGLPMSGAAGGLAGGLWAQFGAELVGGAAFVLAAVGYDARMRAARAVITGEGRLDRQSLDGKIVSEVATRARQAGVPCHAVVGANALDLFDLRILDLQLVLEATTLPELEAAGAELGAAIQAESARGR